MDTFSCKQCKTFNLILLHSQQEKKAPPLIMIIQGTTRTEKSYLIISFKASLNMHSPYGHSLILLIPPTRVSSFNIQETTIHVALKIAIKQLWHLQAQTLGGFQEEMKHIRYVLIDEMRFIGTKLFMHIEILLCEEFPEKKQFSIQSLLYNSCW
jgi:hypothetical protein